MKKALLVASMASSLDNFARINIDLLQKMGYEVTLAANFLSEEDANPKEKNEAFAQEMKAQGVEIVQIDFSRKIGNVKKHVKAISQIEGLLGKGYDLLHCQTPIGAALSRICVKRMDQTERPKVIYTAHGFHFFKGAPLINWLFFYPIEKHLSRFTDVLITINHEDHERALKRFKAKKTVFIPGVGIDVQSIKEIREREKAEPKDVKIPENAVILMSVGELSERKNHEIVIEALNEINRNELYYVIVGRGALTEKLKNLDATGRVIFTGYRTDVIELLTRAELFVFPSLQEGLPVALMEAMAVGTVCVCSRIRGNTDLIDDRELQFGCRNKDELKNRILDYLSWTNDKKRSIISRNYSKILNYDRNLIREKLAKVYSEV